MNTSIKFINEELKARGIKALALALSNNRTMLKFSYLDKIRIISGTSSDLTSSTGSKISDMKDISSLVAKDLDIPIPETVMYESLEQAGKFLEKHKMIVIKPIDGAHGDDVITSITTTKHLADSISRLESNSRTTLIQQQVSGSDLRVLVIDGQAVAVSERQPANIIGDGKHSTEELIQIENDTNPQRGLNYSKKLNVIDIEASKRYLGKAIFGVPNLGEKVVVSGVANVGAGGEAVNRTGEVPTGLLEQAERFSKQIGIFTCGVDFMYDSDSKKWYFIEANSSPSFGLHMWPARGEAVNVARIFVDKLLQAYAQRDNLVQIGRNISVDINGHAEAIPAKVDTGADRSSIWASDIRVNKDKTLSFCLFDSRSPHYTGKVITKKQFSFAFVRSASGHMQLRYNTTLSIRLGGKNIRASFNLSDRSKNKFPILIGRRTLAGKFLIDVTKDNYPHISREIRGISEPFKQELKKDPYRFHKKHYGKDINNL